MRRNRRTRDGALTPEEIESVRRMEAAIRRRTEASERSFAEELERWKRNETSVPDPVARVATRP